MGGGRFKYLCDGCRLSNLDRILICPNFIPFSQCFYSRSSEGILISLPCPSSHTLLEFSAPLFRFYNSWMCREECDFQLLYVLAVNSMVDEPLTYIALISFILSKMSSNFGDRLSLRRKIRLSLSLKIGG